MEIEEVFQDVKKATGDKGFLILGAVVVGIFIYNVTRQDTSDTTLVPATGYTGYPSVETNANVIIDSVGKTIDYAQGEIQDSIKESEENTADRLDNMMNNITDQFGELGTNMNTSQNELKDYLNSNFTATNNYINTGLQAQRDLINMNQSQLTTQVNDMNTKLDYINSKTDTVIQNTTPKPTGKITGGTVGTITVKDNIPKNNLSKAIESSSNGSKGLTKKSDSKKKKSKNIAPPKIRKIPLNRKRA